MDAAPHFDASIEATPPVQEELLREIPAARGVVLLEDADARPIVLLTAADMRARTRNRLTETEEDKPSRQADLGSITRRILYRRCYSHFEADWRYLELARLLWPKRYARMVSWKAAWFVHLDVEEEYPHFAYRRGALTGGPYRLGPFASARDAGRFIEAVQDAFDLCRSLNCLRRSPNGPRCAYAEMGRCVSPADGTISMDDYRDLLNEAWAFAAGRREPLRESLETQMKQAAADLRFEQAEACRNRLERLRAFDNPAYRDVRELCAFRFLLLQRGTRRGRVRVFLARQGSVEELGDVAKATNAASWQELAGQIPRHLARPIPYDDASELRLGLVARLLRVSPQRQGAILRLHDNELPQAGDLARLAQRRRKELNLPEPRKDN